MRGFLEPISVFWLLSQIFWFPSRFLVSFPVSGSTNFPFISILSGISEKWFHCYEVTFVKT